MVWLPRRLRFARAFDVYDGLDILFIAGNGNVWGLSDYKTVRDTIDAKARVLSDINFTWDATLRNANGEDVNIPSRSGARELFGGDHIEGVKNRLTLWGENNNGGVNVWVFVAPVPVPLSVLFLMTAGFGMAGLRTRSERSKAASRNA